MNFKQKIASAFVRFFHGWNESFHQAFEKQIQNEFKRSFPHRLELDESVKIMNRMRSFYYQRMMSTASILTAFASLFVALIALIIAFIAIFPLK